MAFTYFYRDLQTVELFVEHLMSTVSGKQHVDIWDAGCASGQEPYTLAILLAERMNPFAFRNLRIFGTDVDISNQFGEIIREGIYSELDLQRIPQDIREKYFRAVTGKPGFLRIGDSLREKIRFSREDLLTLRPAGGELAGILCKNVLLHLSVENRVSVFRMFHAALAQGGILAVEQTQPLPEEVSALFESVVTHAQIFRKR